MHEHRQNRLVCFFMKPGSESAAADEFEFEESGGGEMAKSTPEISVVGVVYYKMHRERGSTEASIDVLCVSPLYRRSGLGRFLLGVAVEDIVSCASADDYEPWVSLKVLNQHAVAGCALIEKCGFKEAPDTTEPVPWYKRNMPQPHVMSKTFHLNYIRSYYQRGRKGGYLKALMPGRILRIAGAQEAELKPMSGKRKELQRLPPKRQAPGEALPAAAERRGSEAAERTPPARRRGQQAHFDEAEKRHQGYEAEFTRTEAEFAAKAETQAKYHVEELAHKLKVEKENNKLRIPAIERDAMRIPREPQGRKAGRRAAQAART